MSFHRWSELSDGRPREGMRAVGVLELPQCFVYMVEPRAGYRVIDQVHRSEQVVQVLEGSLRLHVDGHGERDLGSYDLAVVPAGHHHHGEVLADSRIFELNCPRDNENLYARSAEWPPPSEPLQDADGAPIGPFVRWRAREGERRRVLGERLEVARHLVPARNDTAGATKGGVFQVLSGTLSLSVNGETCDLTPDWVAVMQPGDEWRARNDAPVELLEVFFR